MATHTLGCLSRRSQLQLPQGSQWTGEAQVQYLAFLAIGNLAQVVNAFALDYLAGYIYSFHYEL